MISRGLPDVGWLLERQRIGQTLDTMGGRPVLFVAPSGYGKTYAAIGYARDRYDDFVWVDCSAGMPKVTNILAAVCRAAGGERGDAVARQFDGADGSDALVACSEILAELSTIRRVCVLLDDMSISAAEDGFASARGIAALLSDWGGRVIVTTQQVEGDSEPEVRHFGVVGVPELELSTAEAVQIFAALHGREGSADAVEVALDSSGGHAAFFAILARHQPAERWSSNVTLGGWIRHIAVRHLTAQQLRLLHALSLMKEGSLAMLTEAGVSVTASDLDAIAHVLPLLSVSSSQAHVTFRVHDALESFCSRGDLPEMEAPTVDFIERLARVMTAYGRHARVADLVARYCPPSAIAAWACEIGPTLRSHGALDSLAGMMQRLRPSDIIGSPALLLLSAELASDLGDAADTIAKCSAARSLAIHYNDRHVASEALQLKIMTHYRIGQHHEAADLSGQLWAEMSSGDCSAEAVSTFVSTGLSLLVGGEFTEAISVIGRAQEMAQGLRLGEKAHWSLVRGRTFVAVVARGNHTGTLDALSPFLCTPRRGGDQLIALGNLGVALVELGRLRRAQSALDEAIRRLTLHGVQPVVAGYLPSRGCIEAATGDWTAALESFREGLWQSEQLGDHVGAEQNRVFHAVVLRACGRIDESLTAAERAFEFFSAKDVMRFRGLSALEVAASMLALGDCSAARAWAETVIEEGFDGNEYHRLRGEMILAEVDRRSGELASAVARLQSCGDHIRSENSNWQIAMYCRAFPALLGVFALAIGVEELPAHLLQMVLPEYAEKSLLETRRWLAKDVWTALGLRLLGEEEHARFIERDGRPLCHVRLLGGLEVTIAGRVIREKDWRKRKARLLFAMLAVRRGQDVPRDQVFEYLWPDMDEERAKNNLYVVWSTMKAVLATPDGEGNVAPYIESVGGMCRILMDSVRLDLEDFDRDLARAKEAEAAGDIRAALAHYEHAGDLYRGDLLPGDVYDDWFASLRDHYKVALVDAMLRASRLLMEADKPADALIFVRRAIQSDPFREDLYQAALRCQIEAGQRSAAIETYTQCRRNLADELGLDPSPETRALYDQILGMEDKPRYFDPLGE